MKNFFTFLEQNVGKLMAIIAILLFFNLCSVNKSNRLLVENKTYYDNFIIDEIRKTDSVSLIRMEKTISNHYSIFIRDIKSENLNTLYLFLLYEKELDENRIDLSTIKTTLESYGKFLYNKDTSFIKY